MKNMKEVNYETSFVQITTITFTAKFNVPLDLDRVRTLFKTPVQLLTQGLHITPFRWEESNNSDKFYNQVSIRNHGDTNNKSVKLFPNGSMQCTGCTDIDDCHRVVDQVSLMLGLERPEPCIHMINTNFFMRGKINLVQAYEQLLLDGYKVSFDPDRYCAVKVKVENVSCSIFSTGNVIMTGAKSIQEILDTHKHMITQLSPYVYTKEQDKKDVFYMGYNCKVWKDFFCQKICIDV